MKNDFDPLFQINGKKILIAGACGGIGIPICKFLYDRGGQLLLLDLYEKKLYLQERKTGKVQLSYH